MVSGIAVDWIEECLRRAFCVSRRRLDRQRCRVQRLSAGAEGVAGPNRWLVRQPGPCNLPELQRHRLDDGVPEACPKFGSCMCRVANDTAC